MVPTYAARYTAAKHHDRQHQGRDGANGRQRPGTPPDSSGHAGQCRRPGRIACLRRLGSLTERVRSRKGR